VKKTTGEKVIILNQRGPDLSKWRRAPDGCVTPLDTSMYRSVFFRSRWPWVAI